LCAVSEFVAQRTSELLNLRERRIEILHNPVDVSAFRPRTDVPEQPGLILFVGTVCEKKGIRQLVQAMPAVVRSVPDARLWVAGRDTTDPNTGRSFTSLLRDLVPADLSRHVEFKGAVPHAELSTVIARASVCVYPSHMEALPLAWLEGLAMQKAIVASETGPGREVIEHGVSGLLCDPHNPDSIATQVIRLLRDDVLRRRIAMAARRRAEDRFAIGPLLARNEEFYEGVRERRRA
jgi:glycosyltransferase involved in cell wall biosynthesis